MEEAREALAHLLVQIENQDSTDARIEAMEVANRLALRFGDPNLSDVAEALSADLDELTDHQEFQVQVQRSLARATRRAIALAHRQGASTPSELLEWLAAEPQVIAQEIHRNLDSNQRGLAQAILEVGLWRHPDSAELAHAKMVLDHGESGSPLSETRASEPPASRA